MHTIGKKLTSIMIGMDVTNKKKRKFMHVYLYCQNFLFLILNRSVLNTPIDECVTINKNMCFAFRHIKARYLKSR